MNFSDMVGKTIVGIDGLEVGSEFVFFRFSDGTAAQTSHMRDCCESVEVKQIEGDLNSVLGSVVTSATSDEFDRGEPAPEYPDSWTWTIQRIATERGKLVIKWLGESNGYYGETPYFQRAHGDLV